MQTYAQWTRQQALCSCWGGSNQLWAARRAHQVASHAREKPKEPVAQKSGPQACLGYNGPLQPTRFALVIPASAVPTHDQ